VAEREQIYKNLDEAPALYVNSVQVVQSQFDIRMVMGIMTDSTSEKVVTKVSAIVHMSPQHAKVFAELLSKHIEKYEQLHGPLNVARLFDNPDVKAAGLMHAETASEN